MNIEIKDGHMTGLKLINMSETEETHWDISRIELILEEDGFRKIVVWARQVGSKK